MPSVLSIVAAAPFLILIGWIALRRRFLLYLLLFVLIAFAWRLASGIYIDTRGPLYTETLFRAIGGGWSSLVLVATQAVTLLAVLLVFSPARLRSLAEMRVKAEPSRLSLSNTTLRALVFGSVLLFLVLLFADMARSGIIPLVEGIEEHVFSQRCAGILHGLLIRFGDVLCFSLGLLHWNPLLLGKKKDKRFLLLFLGILVYMLLAGHRFSAFYRFTTIFLMPVAAVVLQEEFRGHAQHGRADAGRPSGRAYISDTALIAAAVIAMALLGTYRSLFFTVTSECAIVRPSSTLYQGPGPAVPPGQAVTEVVSSRQGGALSYLRQRVLVQQGELWWVTYERIFLRDEFEPFRAFTRVFTDPILHPRRNSTIPYLMERAIGDRANKTLAAGSQYTGGFPEIFFELLGKALAFPAIFVMSLIMARLLLMLVESVLLQRAVRTFLIFYVLYAFILIPITGMLNFLVNWIFWLKVSALVAWLVLEHRMLDAQGVRMVPVHLAGRSDPSTGS